MKYFDIKEFILVAFICLLGTAVMLFAPQSTELLRYQSVEVSQGDWWRIITANFTHSSWNHWLLNLCGLLLIDYLFQPTVKQTLRTYLIIFCMLTNVLLLHLFMQLYWYVGLSGALHGYLLGGALLTFKQSKAFASLIILVVCVKLTLELNWEINQFTANLIGANVVEESHLFGAISGAIFFIFYVIINQLIVLIKSNQSKKT